LLFTLASTAHSDLNDGAVCNSIRRLLFVAFSLSFVPTTEPAGTVTLKKETFEGLPEFLSSSCAGRTTNVQRVLSVRTGVRVVPALIVPFLIFTSLIVKPKTGLLNSNLKVTNLPALTFSTGGVQQAKYLSIDRTGANYNSLDRAYGMSVRCIKSKLGESQQLGF
jgi:hypothetical protein